MSRNSGRNLKVYMAEDPNAETPTFVKVAAVRSKSFSIGRTRIDVETDDDEGIAKALKETTGKIWNVPVEGLVEDDMLLEYMSGSEPLEFALLKLVRPNGSYLQGLFFFENYEETGGYQDAHAFSSTFSSAAEIAFTPAS